MSLSAQVRINADTIGHIECRRVVTGENGIHTYDYEYLTNGPDGISTVKQGFLDHAEKDGALVLLRTALDRITQKRIAEKCPPVSVEDRITEILIDQWVPSEVRYGTDEPVGFDSPRKWAAHVARVLVTELGLTEETGFRYTHSANGNSHILMNLDVEAARRMASRSHSLTEVARYVTPWENT